jgi:hypothetical protein
MTRLLRSLTEHPHSVGETYWQHMASALSFALPLLLAAAASLLHGLLPFLCVKTASGLVTRLHGRMVVNRERAPRALAEGANLAASAAAHPPRAPTRR